MRHLLFAFALGSIAGFQPACGGACSHNCCAGSHCNCAGSHCCQAPPSADPNVDQHNHCAALRQDFECSVTFRDGNGDVIEHDSVLYEQFAYQEGATETCSVHELQSPDAPEDAVTAECSCAPIDGAPDQLKAN